MGRAAEAGAAGGRPWLYWIGATPRSAERWMGGKAAGLNRLAKAGLPVPSGFCLSTRAWERHLHAALPAGERRRLIGALPDEGARRSLESLARAAALDGPPRAQLRRAAGALAGEGARGLLCVRSSAAGEDSAGASHAGQHDSFLGVAAGDVEDAVRRCWASLWSRRAVEYRQRLGIPHRSARMAVVVQRLVEPRATALAFTADPTGTSRDVLLVSAVPGRGEELAAGRESGDLFVLDRRSRRIVSVRPADAAVAPRDPHARVVGRRPLALGGEQARALAGACLDIEALFGTPVDVEAVLGEDGWLFVQARPVTALAEPAR